MGDPRTGARAATADDAGHGGLQLIIGAGPARFVADEPVDAGGLDLGPTPHDLLSAALAACTAQTLRLYAGRKGWPLGAVRVEVIHSRDASATPPDHFQRTVSLGGGLADDQRARLMELAERCPVHRLLTTGAGIDTVEVTAEAWRAPTAATIAEPEPDRGAGS
jgi:putative redox protein